MIETLRRRTRALKQDTVALYLAVRDPRTPWYAKAVAAAVVVYALSPIDLIPDFIPVLGYLDDLVVVPLGLAIAMRLVPDQVMADCREQARAASVRPTSWVGAALIIGMWLVAVALAVLFVKDLLDG